MPRFFVRADLCITDRDRGDASQPYGPLFTRWVPNGKNDALVVALKNGSLRFWFERRGYMSSPGMQFVEYDPDRKEVDECVIPRQGKLDGGHLHIELELSDVNEAAIASLEGKDVSDPHYVKLLKQVISQIQPYFKRLLSLLRINYGQYWIKEVAEVRFDSPEAVEMYCASLPLQWSMDGQNWSLMTKMTVSHIGEFIFGGEEQYLSQSDWTRLQELLQAPCEPTTTEVLLVSTSRLLDQKQLKHALIEGVTAIEIAIEEALRRMASTPDDLIQQSFDEFRNLALPLRFIIVASQRKDLDQKAFDQALQAIKLRNDVVHRGAEVPNTLENGNMIGSLMFVTAQIIGRQGMRFPHFTHVAPSMAAVETK